MCATKAPLLAFVSAARPPAPARRRSLACSPLRLPPAALPPRALAAGALGRPWPCHCAKPPLRAAAHAFPASTPLPTPARPPPAAPQLSVREEDGRRKEQEAWQEGQDRGQEEAVRGGRCGPPPLPPSPCPLSRPPGPRPSLTLPATAPAPLPRPCPTAPPSPRAPAAWTPSCARSGTTLRRPTCSPPACPARPP